MKRLTLFLIVMLLLPVVISAQTPADTNLAPYQLVAMGSGFVSDDLNSDSWGGGLKLGFEMNLDDGRGLRIRTLYSRFKFGPLKEEVQAIDVNLLMDWYVGKLWTFYLNFGATNYVDGPQVGTDPVAGIGFSRLLWSHTPDGGTGPAQMSMFAEVMTADANENYTGNYLQVNVGLKFRQASR